MGDFPARFAGKSPIVNITGHYRLKEDVGWVEGGRLTNCYTIVTALNPTSSFHSTLAFPEFPISSPIE